jgi:hypothetical protein
MDVNWPDSEPIPQNMEQALALQWEIIGSGVDQRSDDERTQSGNIELKKYVGMLELYLEIPFRAEYTYGQPHSASAIVRVPENAVPS